MGKMPNQYHVHHVTVLVVRFYLGLFCVEHNVNIIAFKGKQGAKTVIRLHIDRLKENRERKKMTSTFSSIINISYYYHFAGHCGAFYGLKSGIWRAKMYFNPLK